MMEAIFVWPLPWALTILIGISIAGATWFVGYRQSAGRSRMTRRLAPLLAKSGLEGGPGSLAVSGSDTALVISGERMAVLDLVEYKLVAAYSLAQVEALTIFDDKDSKAVDFRLDLVAGAHTRRISTASMPEFCRLFDYFHRVDKRVRFIAE